MNMQDMANAFAALQDHQFRLIAGTYADGEMELAQKQKYQEHAQGQS